MRLGLFGGSFDPIHLGHQMLAQCAWQEAALDRVHFIPCRQSPHKTGATQASAEQRCAMIELAIADCPWAELNRLELERPEPSYSWQTAQTLAEQHPGAELFWILGTDQWEVIETWARADLLAELLTFLVFPRGRDPQPREGFRMQKLNHVHPASATDVRESQEAAKEMLDARVYEFIVRNRVYSWSER